MFILKNKKIRILTISALLSACSPMANYHGYSPETLVIDKVKVGQTKEDVRNLLGSPSSGSSFKDNAWYYVYEKIVKVAFSKPKVLEQQIVVIHFDSKDVVSGVERHIQDPEKLSIAFSKDRTKVEGGKHNLIKDMARNLGRKRTTSQQK